MVGSKSVNDSNSKKSMSRANSSSPFCKKHQVSHQFGTNVSSDNNGLKICCTNDEQRTTGMNKWDYKKTFSISILFMNKTIVAFFRKKKIFDNFQNSRSREIWIFDSFRFWASPFRNFSKIFYSPKIFEIIDCAQFFLNYQFTQFL